MQIASSPRDRTSGGKQEDLSGPAIEEWLQDMETSTCEAVKRIGPGTAWVCDKLIGLCYERKVDLVLTSGGTGPSPRDETPKVMREVLINALRSFEMRSTTRHDLWLAQPNTNRPAEAVRNRQTIFN